MKNRKLVSALLIFVVLLAGYFINSDRDYSGDFSIGENTDSISVKIAEDGRYTGVEEVAEYIKLYGKLPDNYLTKKEARALGWESDKGNLWEVTDHMSIGGDPFGNREGLLPESEGRKWYECDINYKGGFRGAERIVFSNDGLIYYTGDHYESFQKIY